MGTLGSSLVKFNGWSWDGTGACSKPEEKISAPSVGGEPDSDSSSGLHVEAAFDDRSLPYTFYPCKRDSQSVRRNSPLGKEKVPGAEPFGSLMGSQHDQRGGGPDERTNNGTKDSCHRSHVRALVIGGRDTSFLGRARSGRSALNTREGKERPGLRRAHQGRLMHCVPLASIRQLSSGRSAHVLSGNVCTMVRVTSRRRGISRKFSVHLS